MIVGIKFGDNSKVYSFNADGFNLSEGDNVIVDTEKGSQYGTVVSLNIEKNNKIEYKNVLRIANKNDYKKYMNNIRDAKNAVNKCNDLIQEYDEELAKDIIEQLDKDPARNQYKYKQRLKRMIVTSGYNVYPSQIESVKYLENVTNKNKYKVYPVYYPVGNGIFNIDKSIEDIIWIIDNNIKN